MITVLRRRLIISDGQKIYNWVDMKVDHMAVQKNEYNVDRKVVVLAEQKDYNKVDQKTK